MRKFCWIFVLCSGCAASPAEGARRSHIETVQAHDASGRAARPPNPQRATPPPQVDALPDSRWGLFESQNHGLGIPLPDAHHWEQIGGPARWLSLQHARSSSRLKARLWRASRRARKSDCRKTLELWERRARRLSDLALVRRPLFAPEGFDSEMWISLDETDGRPLLGFIVAVGAGVRRCFAAIFETATQGPRARERLARRLSLASHGSIGGIRLLQVENRWRPQKRP